MANPSSQNLAVKSAYLIALPLVAILIVSSGAAAYYYSRYNQVEAQNKSYVEQLKKLGVEYSSHFLVDFGNGTQRWYNGTTFEPGTNVYVATQVIAGGSVNATYYTEYSEHLITAMFNIANAGDNYWGLWTYNFNSTSGWQLAQVGPDDLQVTNGSTFAWSYGANSGPP